MIHYPHASLETGMLNPLWTPFELFVSSVQPALLVWGMSCVSWDWLSRIGNSALGCYVFHYYCCYWGIPLLRNAFGRLAPWDPSGILVLLLTLACASSSC